MGQLQFDGSEVKSDRSERIRSLFVQSGGRWSIRDFARMVIATDIYSDEDKERMMVRSVSAEVRQILRKSQSVLPWAGPTLDRTDDGQAVWAQMEFWNYEDHCLNYTKYRQLATDNAEVATAIAEHCNERFGKEPVFIEGLE